MIILHNNEIIDTDISYKITNTHDYLRYDSNHPVHVKNNIPFTLAKKIIIFVRMKSPKDSLSRTKNMVTRKQVSPSNH